MNKKHFISIIQNNNKNRKHIKKKKIQKKTKTWTKFKETGDFTVPKGHGYPLVYI